MNLRTFSAATFAQAMALVKTEMGGEGAPMELEDGAKTSVELATLPADGPSGGFFHMGQTLPW